MPATIPRDRVRIAADAASASNIIDSITGKNPSIWRGADMQFEIGVFYNGNLATDISNIASITLEMKDPNNPSGPALVGVAIAASAFTQAVTLGNWQNKTAQHCVVPFSAAQTDFNLQGAESIQLWLVIGVTTNDATPLYFPIGVGRVTVYESGFSMGDSQISTVAPPVRVGQLLVQCPDNDLWYYVVPRVIDGVMTPSIQPTDPAAGIP